MSKTVTNAQNAGVHVGGLFGEASDWLALRGKASHSKATVPA